MNAISKSSRLAALLLPAALLMAQNPPPPSYNPPPPPNSAPFLDDEDYQGEAPERYAMVRALEGDVQITKGDLTEALTRGTPIGEGDVVESRGRGVLQLGDGTRVAFGGDTRFTVATLFTDEKGEKQVLLRLDYGRLRMLLGSDARFRVDTPSGTVSCAGKSSFSMDAQRDRLVRIKVLSGRVSFANDRDEVRINAGERLTVHSPQDALDRVRSFNTYDRDAFDSWSEGAMALHRGQSWDHVPAEIRYYADDLDANGRWVQTEEFGWVWQPNGVAEDWRPYYQGRWAPYAGGMTWISDEPWAYVAYHHGRWHWGAGLGWCWIPGIYYSPAWVAWNHTPGYAGWAPLGFHNTPCHWGYGAWGGGYAWNVVAIGNLNAWNVRTQIRVDVNVFHAFNGAPGRDLRAPWQRSPLVVTRAEFHNPAQIQGVFQRDVNRERLRVYEHQAQVSTGRVIYREPRPSAPAGGGADPRLRAPFENRGPGGSRTPEPSPRQRPMDPRPNPVDRMPEPSPRQRPADPRPGPVDRTPQPAPWQRPVELRPAPVERTPEPSPRQRPMEPRPNPVERAPEPSPRQRPADPRPAPVERAPEPSPRQRPMEPRPTPVERAPEPSPRQRPMESRPAREERRPEPAPRAEREPRPAPKPEAPKEHPKQERPKEEHK